MSGEDWSEINMKISAKCETTSDLFAYEGLCAFTDMPCLALDLKEGECRTCMIPLICKLEELVIQLKKLNKGGKKNDL